MTDRILRPEQAANVDLPSREMASQLKEFLRLKEAAHYLNLSLTTLWRLSERDSTFPKKIKLGERLCYYRKSDLDNWLKTREV